MAATSRFIPNSFFFTDPDALSQSSAQAFGPESEDTYRLTSKFSFAADTNAYAICTGVILVQPQTGNAGLVNLILRPFKQPITGFNIKYFVYRGLNIGDFFDGANVIAASDDASDFINKINTSFTAYYSATGTTAPTFLASFIGFDPANQPATTLISDLFFKVAGETETPQTAFELPLIMAGATLGTFANGECGIDIVLDYGDYKLLTQNDQFTFDLNYARAAEATIDVTNISDDFQQQLLKEQIFQFLDVAAFYGFHAGNGTVSLNSDGTTISKTGQDIYNSVIQNFNTKNTFYLYIQSDRTRSYNFYGNYAISDGHDNCLLTGFSADALSERDYETNGWPVIILTTTQSISDPNIILYIQFVTDNNDNTVLYGQVGQILSAQGNNFSGPDDLQQDTDDSGNQPNLSKVFQLSNPAAGDVSSKNYIGTFNILIYQGEQYTFQPVTDNTVAFNNGYLDGLFGEINSTPLFKNTATSAYTIINIQKCNLVNSYFNKIQYGVSAVQYLIINDSLETGLPDVSTVTRVQYIAGAIDVMTQASSTTSALTNDTKATSAEGSNTTGATTYILPAPYYYSLIPFTDNAVSVNGLQMQTTDSSTPNKIVVGITNDENAAILTLIPTDAYNPILAFIDVSPAGAGFTSPEGINFQKYKLGLVAEKSDGLVLYEPENDVLIYSIDRVYFFSAAYSKFMPASILDSTYIPDNPVTT